MKQISLNAAADWVPHVLHRTAPILAKEDWLVYVAYCPDGQLSPLHLCSLGAYAAEGYRVLLVVNSGADDHRVDPGKNSASILIVRENIGFDFGGWGHASRIVGDLDIARSVTFVNDSLIGPLPGDGSGALKEIVDDVDAEVVFMTESSQLRPHGQSYFFAFKKPAIEKGAVGVIRASLYFSDKKRVVLNEEITLSSRLQANGISVRAAFLVPDAWHHGVNPTFFYWDQLVAMGFPFVKVSLIPDKKISIDDPVLGGIIGPAYLACLRTHLEKRPIPPPVQFAAVPNLIRTDT